MDVNRQQELLALTDDPNFIEGLEAGRMGYQEVYRGRLPRQERVLEEIEENLSTSLLAEQYALPYISSKIQISHAYHLGFIVSWLDAYVAAKESNQ